MEQDFQTSFIPKKPIINDRVAAPRPVGLLTIISFLLLFVMIISSGKLDLLLKVAGIQGCGRHQQKIKQPCHTPLAYNRDHMPGRSTCYRSFSASMITVVVLFAVS